jgi:hypothetical protein
MLRSEVEKELTECEKELDRLHDKYDAVMVPQTSGAMTKSRRVNARIAIDRCCERRAELRRLLRDENH